MSGLQQQNYFFLYGSLLTIPEIMETVKYIQKHTA